RPDGRLVPARVLEVQPPAAGTREYLLRDRSAGVLNAGERRFEVARVHDDQRWHYGPFGFESQSAGLATPRLLDADIFGAVICKLPVKCPRVKPPGFIHVGNRQLDVFDVVMDVIAVCHWSSAICEIPSSENLGCLCLVAAAAG